MSLAAGSDGALWVGTIESFTSVGSLTRITTDGVIATMPVEGGGAGVVISDPRAGALWVSFPESSTLVRIKL